MNKGVYREALKAFLSVHLCILAIVLSTSLAPGLGQYTQALIALVFLITPQLIFGLKNLQPDSFGLTTESAPQSLLWGLILTILTLAPFAGGYYLWQTVYLDRELHFRTGHFYQWSPKLDGKPTQWNENSGVWLWENNRRLFLRAKNTEGRRSFTLRIHSSTPLDSPKSFATHRQKESKQNQYLYQLKVTASGGGFKGVLTSFRKEKLPPRSLSFHVEGPSDQVIHVGPQQQVVGQSHHLDRTISWIWLWFLTHFIAIALPEEYFYRGYLQTRLNQGFETSDYSPVFLGLSFGNIAASTLFAIGHLIIPIGGQILWNRVGVFFPSLLFGWLRERTNNISGSVLYHASCNMMVLLAEIHFFSA